VRDMASEGKRFSRYVGEHASVIPSLLPVTEFFAARAAEVVRLYESAKPRTSHIPRHRRRRMRSFKPFNYKPKLKQGTISFPLNISRRTRRRHRMYMEQQPGEKTRLPTTHVWHAKRFRMGNIWGMRLPLKVSNKGERAILRISQEGSVITDRSYMDCWRLDAMNVTTAGLVERLCSIGLHQSVGHPRVISGEIMYSKYLVVDDRIISPCQAVWDVGGSAVDVYSHPASRGEMRALMEQIGAKLNNQRVRFELIGSGALDRLQKILGCDIAYISLVPGQLQRVPKRDIRFFTRAAGRVIDLLFGPEEDTAYWWRRLVHLGSSPIGVYDRHTLLTHSSIPDFPFDFPASRAGAIQAATHAKLVLDIDSRRPKQSKLNTDCVESTYFPDWTLLGYDRIPATPDLKHVVVQTTRGSIKWNAHIYWGRQLIGYVTSPVRGADQRCIGIVRSDVALELNSIYVRNPGSRNSIAANVLPLITESSDSYFIADI
jgi:hypothetical protein